MNKEEQKQLIVDIMNEDTKDGLYKQQTAVEYLVEQLKRIGFSTNNLIEFENEVIIAKEMEKQQMIEFGYACTKQIEMNEAGELLMVKSPEEVYNETYSGC
jgi:hypothetical protein